MKIFLKVLIRVIMGNLYTLFRLASFYNKKKQVNNVNPGYIKYKKGDEVKITIYNEIPDLWYKGKVLDIRSGYSGNTWMSNLESTWKVEYYVCFKNNKGDDLKYWFLESELRKYDLQEERNSRIEQLLK